MTPKPGIAWFHIGAPEDGMSIELNKTHRPIRGIFTSILLAVAALPAAAADEADQYLVWGTTLNDSAPAINAFINERVQATLGLVNKDNPGCDCETLTAGIITDIYQDRFRAEISRFIDATESVDVYPRRDTTNGEILDTSIYRHAITGLTIRVTRNIRIGEVYLGTDKLSHFFGIGRRYYTRYRGLLRDGQSPEQAEQEAILWGLLTENTFLGTTTNGIFSFADLEANYQGFRLAQDLCTGSDPFLRHEDGRWIQVRPVDLTAYVSPYFDETYLPPLYGELIRNAVHLVVERDYSSHVRDTRVAERFATYRALTPPPSRSMQIVGEFLREHEIPSQRPALLAALGLKETDPTAPWDPYSVGTGKAAR